MYSNAVKIANLNDYLNPSEECVLPLIKKEEKYEIKLNEKILETNPLENKHNLGNIIIENDIYKNNKLKVTRIDKNKRITVGLSDCLSCSGCLTSSEEILLKDDNHSTVIENMKENELCVVSISSQSIFMFSSHYEIPAENVLKKLSYLFRQLGAKLVFDLSLGELIALNQSKEEFVSKYFKLVESYNLYEQDKSPDPKDPVKEILPVITSHCPGLTLYAEKTLGQDMVDKISEVPSSQMIQGLLVKILCHTIRYYKKIYNFNYLRLLSPFSSIFNVLNMGFVGKTYLNNGKISLLSKLNTGLSHKKVYHVSVVPCYDKKFELVRSEFKYNFLNFFNFLEKGLLDCNLKLSDPDKELNDNEKIIEEETLVDDILTTSDVERILVELNIEFEDLKEIEVDFFHNYLYFFEKFSHLVLTEPIPIPIQNMTINEKNAIGRLVRCSELYCQSGGFAEEVFKHSCNVLFETQVTNFHFSQTINEDFKECLLYDDENNVLLRFVIAYGFKNIKNIIKLLKPNPQDMNNKKDEKAKYDYVELMSCPGGCFNGAGQALTTKPRKRLTQEFTNFLSKLIPEKFFKNLQDTLKSLENLSKKLPEKFNFLEKYYKHLPERFNSLENLSNYFSEGLNFSEKLSNYFPEGLNFSEKLSKHVQETLNSIEKISKNLQKKSHKLIIDSQKHQNTTKLTPFQKFIEETEYLTTEDPLCQYFSNLLKHIPDLKLSLKSHKNLDLHW